MRAFILTFLLILSFWANAQTHLEGKYRDYFGYSIELINNRTFEFNYRFDLASGWAIGTWKIDGDTINLNVTPILDTLTRKNQLDSLVLSYDRTSSRITEEQFAINQITSGGQLPTYAPTRLLNRKMRLYKFDKNNKLRTKKVRGIFSEKKYPSYYFKIDSTTDE